MTRLTIKTVLITIGISLMLATTNLSFAFYFVSAQEYRTIDPTNSQHISIIKPSVDRGIQYKYIELHNELKVLLVHDPNTEMANAALDVLAGSWDEPKEYPGIAHLCEHMLFIGSAKYPNSEYFDNLLAKGSGSSNAYTDSTNTNYYFEIASEQLGKALDVFAHFFIDPLFSPELVEREKNAVNSEYEIDVSAEEWKVQNLLTLLAKPDHPASRFSLGNNESFNKNDIASALKQFHRENYSSNLMSLVVQSKLSIEEMEKTIKPFAKIENKQLNQKIISGFPYQFGLLCKYHAEKNQVILNWQLSGREQFVHQKPISFIDEFLNNGNLVDYLKEKEFIIDFQTEVFSEESTFANYMITLTLSEKSSQNDLVAIELAHIINNYISQLEDWLSDDKYLEQSFDEQSKMSKINFNFMEESLDASTIAKSLNKNIGAEVLSSQFIMDKLDKDLIFKYLEELKKTDNLLILVGNEHFSYEKEQQNFENNKQFLKSKSLGLKNELYRVEFSKQQIDDKSIQFITKQDENLKQHFTKSGKNEFIPQDLKMISLCDSQKLPQLIHSDKLNSLDHESKLNLFVMAGQQPQSLTHDQCPEKEHIYQKYNHYPILLNKELQEWWKSATSYQVPTIYGAVQFEYPDTLSIREITSLRIYSFLADEVLSKELKLPLSSGYSYSLDTERRIEIKVYGFSEHIRNFFKKICSCMNPFREKSKSFLEITESKNFQLAKQSLSAFYKELQQEKLFEQALQIYLPQILKKDYPSPNLILKEMDNISETQMVEDVRKILINAKQSSLFIGNLNEEQAEQISKEIKGCTKDENNEKIENALNKFMIINLHKANIIHPIQINSDDNDINGVTLNYYQVGKRSKQSFALMKLLQPILNQQAYNYLRTDLQLGYVVFASFKPVGCIDGAMILVQGIQPPMKVNQLIEEFIQSFPEYLKQLPKREFEHLKHSVVTELKEKPQSITEEGERLWSYIKVGDIEFEERQVAAENLKSISKQDLIEFYEKVFLANQSKISLQLYGKGMVSQTLDLETEQEFKQFIQNTMPKDAKLFEDHEVSYHECTFEVAQI